LLIISNFSLGIHNWGMVIINWYLLIYLSSISRPGDSGVTFRFSSQAATCYYQSNLSKVEATPLSALPKDTTSELASLSSLSTFNAERQAGKL